jgi:acetylornithine deacetylase/succinyl-diaminopimelate desuccinylase-like protein
MDPQTLVLSILVLAASYPGLARRSADQQPPEAGLVRQAVRSWRSTHEAEILEEYRGLLALPNTADDTAGLRQNAEHIRQMLQRRGVEVRLLEAPGSPPVVFGRLDRPGALRTVVFYAHYDGQPVEETAWHSDPWTPVLRDRPLPEGGGEIPWPRPGAAQLPADARLYARSASDDKAPIQALVSALDALQAAGLPLSVNVRFFFEGEEESGSPHVGEVLRAYRDLLDADAWIFCDGPVNQSRIQEVAFGVRGIVTLQATVYGPLRPLHSGHYGNWAPHPTVMLVHLLAGLRDQEGRILIDGFYNDVRPPTAAEQAAVDRIPPIEPGLIRELGLGRTEGEGERLPERILLPALNLSGLQAGGVGDQAANAIPTQARAYLDFRLVPDQDPERVRELVEQHIRGQGFHVVRSEPDLETRLAHPRIIRLDWDKGYPAVRTDMDLPVSRALAAAVSEAVEGRLLLVPTHGGSLPMHTFAVETGAPLITLPIVNHDNNQHGADENLRIQNLRDGIEVFGQVLARLGTLWPER